MKRIFLCLVLLTVIPTFVQPVMAACWKCDNKECKEVESGSSGKTDCLDYSICGGFGCEDHCSTDGADPCTGTEFPPKPDSRSVLIPHGELLELTLPAPLDEPSVIENPEARK